MTTNADKALRMDRWLWYTRFYKTRALASAAVGGGHVRINGSKARAATRVRAGDKVEIVRQQMLYEIEVLAIPERRGPAPEARACYTESEESRRRRQETLQSIRSDRMQMPKTEGKPDKHTRRKLRSRNRREV
jgi:ribosome-associated heat shock protein Hsp15